MYNLVGLFSHLGISPFWAWPFFLAAIVGISLLWRKRLTSTTFGLGIMIALVTSPHLHTHDLALLIVPLLAWPSAAIPLMSIALIRLIPLGLAPFAIYVIMFALAITNWSLTSPPIRRTTEESF
jgi:hypothetical protein